MIRNLSVQFQYVSSFSKNKKTKSWEDLEHTLGEIIGRDTDKHKFLLLHIGNHVLGIFYRDKQCYLYDPNNPKRPHPFPFDPAKPHDSMKPLVKRLLKSLQIDKGSFSLGIEIFSNEDLSKTKNEEFKKSLPLELGRDNTFSAIEIAVKFGYLDAIKDMIKKGLDVNEMLSTGNTLINMAAQLGRLDIIKFLSEKGANLNKMDRDGLTPLHTAAIAGHLNVVKFLSDRGADLNKSDRDGLTPLHTAVQCNHFDIVRFLCKNGAILDQVSKLECTPLMIASAVCHLNIVKFLSDRGDRKSVV